MYIYMYVTFWITCIVYVHVLGCLLATSYEYKPSYVALGEITTQLHGKLYVARLESAPFSVDGYQVAVLKHRDEVRFGRLVQCGERILRVPQSPCDSTSWIVFVLLYQQLVGHITYDAGIDNVT